MMSHVFGCTQIVVSLHARKILVALDLYDWEESGAKAKTEVKMVHIPPGYVYNSLKTWIPKGEGREFHDVMDALGTIFSTTESGLWGRIKTAYSHLSPNDKKMVTKMTESIIQFCKATKKGGRGK